MSEEKVSGGASSEESSSDPPSLEAPDDANVESKVKILEPLKTSPKKLDDSDSINTSALSSILARLPVDPGNSSRSDVQSSSSSAERKIGGSKQMESDVESNLSSDDFDTPASSSVASPPAKRKKQKCESTLKPEMVKDKCLRALLEGRKQPSTEASSSSSKEKGNDSDTANDNKGKKLHESHCKICSEFRQKHLYGSTDPNGHLFCTKCAIQIQSTVLKCHNCKCMVNPTMKRKHP